MHILSPETDNCPSWISGRERMTVENVFFVTKNWLTQSGQNLWLLPRWKKFNQTGNDLQLSSLIMLGKKIAEHNLKYFSSFPTPFHTQKQAFKAVPLLQLLFVCTSVVSYVAFVLSVFVPRPYLFWCLGRDIITKTRLFKYIEKFTTKKWKISDKKF